jgi:pectin methylesterase-like acyl-CoA thioesterase
VDGLQRGTGTRRTLLSRVLAGVALAAPGLLLPETLTEVAAREGVLGGKLGGRHGPNRRGRDKGKRRDNNRNHKHSGNKKGKNKGGKGDDLLAQSTVCEEGCDFSAIQDAIDGTAEGGTIFIKPGTYKTTPFLNKGAGTLIQFKSLTLKGDERDPSKVILDGKEIKRVLFIYLTGNDVTLEGLTIQNGNVAASSGAGIFVQGNGRLILKNCIIKNNKSRTGTGGGITNNGANLIVENTKLFGNRADRGGAFSNLCCGGGTTFVNCEISGNQAREGGGLYSTGPSITLSDTRVTGNTATDRGGGYAARPGKGELVLKNGSTITNNTPSNCDPASACA